MRNNFLRSICLAAVLSSCTQKNGEKPDDNRFSKVVLATDLDEPMQFEILGDERVLFVERKGKIKLFDPKKEEVVTIADIPVRHTFDGVSAGGTNESEDGIQGVLLDPDFERNSFIYVYYSPLEGQPRYNLSRFFWDGGDLNLSSEKVMLEIAMDTGVCCHIGGGMVFDEDGNLLLSTGENSQAKDGYSTIDDRPGHETQDSQKSSANTNDLRGKILRIRPEHDGTYTIPDGNLFPIGIANTRPEIYTMGNRNPWRLSIDSKTGWLYWGEVGPNASVDSDERGPRNYDEFNQARKPGNFGYPYFLGNNYPYRKYDFTTGRSGDKYNPERPENHSRNNTGLTQLPPAQAALIYYPYASSDSFPLLGSGGASAVGGPIFRRRNFKNALRSFPDYYEGKWFITDWVRGWIMAVSMDGQGDYLSMERFLPDLNLKGPIDMDFGPNGDLYVLEYGNGVFKGDITSQLVRIEYNGGNRNPVAVAKADNLAGSVPFEVKLSSSGTQDYDGDKLTYQWSIVRNDNIEKILYDPDPTLILDHPGEYIVTLTVTDSKGAKDVKNLTLFAGNEPPQVTFDLAGANRSFFFKGDEMFYNVDVKDKEDGIESLNDKDASKPDISISYLPPGYDQKKLSKIGGPIDPIVEYGTQLIDKSNCKSCHSLSTASLGPSFKNISERYQNDEFAVDRLIRKILEGGSGIWGEVMMPAHPSIPHVEAKAIVKYILGLGAEKSSSSLSSNGRYLLEVPEGEMDGGSFAFRASYTDKGTSQAPPHTTTELIILRSNVVPVIQFDEFYGVEINKHVFYNMSDISPSKERGYIKLNSIDLTSIQTINLEIYPVDKNAQFVNVDIEIRLDSTTGKLIGKQKIVSSENQNIDIDVVNRIQDLYILFKKGEGKTNMKLKSVTFLRN